MSDKRQALVRRLLERRGIRRPVDAAIPVRRADQPLVLSPSQQRLWFLQHLYPATSAYNLTAALSLSGPLDRASLRQALAALVARHDALRTAFPTVGGEATVDLRAAVDLALQEWDLAAEGARPDDARVRRLIAEHAHMPFDLARPPLARAALIRLGDREHVLVVTAHHIVFDGWSIAILVKELAAHYAAALRGGTAALAPLPIGYADFAVWQRARSARGDDDPDLAYWAAQLADLSPMQLPTDRARTAVASYTGSSLAFDLPRDHIDRLRALGRAHDATLFMTMLAAFFALLGRYTGQPSAVVGSPIAGRERREVEGLIGLFANMLVLRVDLSGEPTFAQLLGRVRTMTRDAYTHQNAPFEAVVERLQPERRLSQQPLFQVAFAMQHEGIGALALPGLDVRQLHVPSTASKFDLTVALTEEGGGVSGTAEYSADLFDTATIQRLLAHYRALLHEVVRSPDTPLDRLPILGPDERARLVRGVSAGVPVAAPVRERLHETFERRVRERPDATAVQDDRASLTYAQLNARANRLARHLTRLGVAAGDRVALHLERSNAIVVSILAVLKAGAAYVPIDPVNPAERVRLIRDDCGAKLLLTDQTLRDAEAAIADERTENLDVAGSTRDLAYVIYTSGSTGRPKGTLIQHDHVQRLFIATDQQFGFGAGDVWTLFHSYGFDFSVWEIWGALRYGGRLVVVPYLTSRSPGEFHQLLASQRVTVLNQTPSAFRQLIEADAAFDTSSLALRTVIFGGEALELDSLRPWFLRHGDQRPRLVNMYGITETTVHVTYRPITMADVERRAGSVIGGPIADLRTYVVDRHLEPVPLGVAGELLVGGAGVAVGYLNRPDLTAERFVPDPFDEGARVYRSGDLARLRANGDLEYLGRLDHQVKIRGFRIELGEIESALTSHDDVREALVLATEREEGGDRRLVAYVTPRGDERPRAADLRRHLQSRLPDYMVPWTFVVLDRLPLTAHGKIDRRALPSAGVDDREAETAFEPPLAGAEQILAEVWAEALGLAAIGRHDNFFAIGGDSIRSIKVLALARDRGLNVSLQDLFQYQTVAAIAAAIGPLEPASAARGRTPPFALVGQSDRTAIAAQGGIEDAYPLTQLQQGMLFHSAYGEQSGTYHNVSSFHLRVPFDQAAFAEALARLIDRHPVLRTSFAASGFSQPLQLVHEKIASPLTVVDLQNEAPGRQAELVDAFLEDERRYRFDWASAPLFRIHVHRRQPNEIQLTLTEHHAILDGWSVATMLSELMADYLGAVGAIEPPTLAPPRVGFADGVRAEIDALADGSAIQFWRDWLESAAAAPLRALGTAPSRRDGEVLTHEVRLDRALTSAIETLAAQEQVPFRTVLLAAHVYVLSVLGADDDVVTGLVTHTRPESADGERALGLFLNTLPLRVRVGHRRWRELLSEVFDRERTLLPRRAYPMPEIQRACGGSRLFQTAFNYVHFHAYDGLAATPGVEVVAQHGWAATEFPLAASFARDVVTGELCLSLESAAPQLDPPALARLGSWYERTLRAIVAAPGGRCTAFSPADADEQSAVAQWSRRRRIEVERGLAFERIAAHARTRPDAVALRLAERSLTYGELEREATALARAFRARGVGREARVGLQAPASPELVVAMLAVWKAGGAFVPLDPSYPAERLRVMIADAAPVLVWRADMAMDRPAADARSLEGPWPSLSADALAYVIYTSGSTGSPKGVMATHRGLRNLLHAQIPAFALTPHSRVLQFAALGFDASISEIFTTLAAGAELVLAPRDEMRSPDRVAELLRRHAITTVTLPPTMLASLAPEEFPALVTAISAGEACHADIVRRWSHKRLVNAYGPTETTVCATMTAPLQASESTPPIGRPLDNLDAWVLTPWLQPVPVGVAGELYVGGDSLARGYYGRPDLTAERFVPHPYGEAGGERLYRTGDRVRWREDGQLDFIDRVDAQMKIRGARVEPGDIEAALLAHPDIRHAAVTADRSAGHARLVAYVEWSGEGSIDAVRQDLATRLPEYALPSVVVPLAAMPMTPSGKIDRRALPDPSTASPAAGVAYVAPRTALESALADIWQAVLRVDRIGVHDNFFRLGGDSILSLQVVSRARAAGIEISPQQIFEWQTIAAIAPAARHSVVAAADRPEGSLALTPIQHWLLELGVPRLHHWNQALLVAIPANVDRARFDRAVEAVLAHHDAFRLRFDTSEGQWGARYTTAAGDAALDVVDLGDCPPAEQPARIEATATVVQTSLNLHSGPLARLVRFDCGANTAGRLLLVAHHLIVDGVSGRVLLDDIQLAYEQLVAGQQVVLPPPSASLQAWAVKLEELARSERVLATLPHWVDALTGPAMPASVTRTGSDNTERDVVTIDRYLDAAATRDLLERVPAAYNTTTAEALLGACAGALAQGIGTPSIRVAVEGHGRDAADLDVARTIGWFTTIYPVRLDFSRSQSARDIVVEAKERMRTVPDKGASFGLLRYLSPDPACRQALAGPIADVSFNYLGQLDASVSARSFWGPAHEPVGPMRDPDAPRPHLVDVVCSIEAGRARMTWMYAGRRFAHHEIPAAADAAIALLGDFIAHCTRPQAGGYTPSDFPEMELTADELEALVEDLESETRAEPS